MSLLISMFFLSLVACSTGESEEDSFRKLLQFYPSGVLDYRFDQRKDGYEFSYNLADGSYRKEIGMILNPGTDAEELVVRGEYGKQTENSTSFRIDGMGFIADKNGFRPHIIHRIGSKVASDDDQQIWYVPAKLLSSLAG